MSARHTTAPLPGDGWERWPHALGYSAKVGELRADIGPDIHPETGMLEWHAVVWAGHRDDVVFESWGYPRDAGEEAMVFMAEGGAL